VITFVGLNTVEGDFVDIPWVVAASAVGSAFLASLVEALTIILAVGTLRGWRAH
jgi:hypothetical protein